MNGFQKGSAALIALAAIFGSSAGASALEATFDWDMRLNEGRVSDAVLAFGVPETDNQPIALICEQGSRRIFATTDQAVRNMRVMGLKSGAQALVVGGTTEYSDEMDAHYFTSKEMDAGAPIFENFAASGSLTMVIQGRETVMTASAPARAKIERFVRFCR